MAEKPDPLTLALQALSRKERTVAELAAWLRTRDVPEAEVDGTITHLIESGGLDDEAFANRYAEDKRELAGWGPERIEAALLVRGVAAETVEAALAVEDHEAQVERAARLLEDRGASLSSDGGRGRALAMLARRGFPREAAYEAVRRAERSQ